MSRKKCLWAQVPTDQPWSNWWPQICAKFRISTDALVEKVQGSEVHWSRLMDSAKTLNLFAKQKVIVIFEAEKALKSDKDSSKWIESLQEGPHWIILQSPQSAPKALSIEIWKSPLPVESEPEDKSSFRWIDALYLGQVSEALNYLETAFRSGQHPLALLQLLSRDFRLGRLIHYAKENRLREEELSSKLKVSPFMIKKWAARPQMKARQWAEVFDRLLAADLELKSGHDDVWVLRKLTLDLSQIVNQENRNQTMQKFRKSYPVAQPLWPTAPSFA